MDLQDFTALYGFNPLDLPEVTISFMDGDARDTIIRATANGTFVSVSGDDKVYAGWKYVNIVHRCFTPTAVTL